MPSRTARLLSVTRGGRTCSLAGVLGLAFACSTGACQSSPISSTESDAAAADLNREKGHRPSVARGLLVAHALGGIGGIPYTNSLDALRCNYARGYRWFEVDLTLTKDGELVCFHPGNEALAGLDQRIEELAASDVARARYANRYEIPLFSRLLNETERLGDVVLVTDTKAWSVPMVAAVKRALGELPGNRSTSVVLQSYGTQDIDAVKRLSQEIRGEVLLTLYMADADDPTVEMLAKRYDVLGVVADSRRFSP